MISAGADPDFARPEVCTKSRKQNYEGGSHSFAKAQPSEEPCGVSFSSCVASLFLSNSEMLGSDFMPRSPVYKVRVIIRPVSWIYDEDGLKQFRGKSQHSTWHRTDDR